MFNDLANHPAAAETKDSSKDCTKHLLIVKVVSVVTNCEVWLARKSK
jgi:hypothetical protein